MKKTINAGFSLVETVISISIATIFITTMVANSFMLYKNLNLSKNKSKNLYYLSMFVDVISNDVFNPDVFPHHPKEEYFFSTNKIIFFANNQKIEYCFLDKNFTILKNNKKYLYNFIKNFNIKYYGKNEFQIFDLDAPYYCEMTFLFNDNKEIKINMRL